MIKKIISLLIVIVLLNGCLIMKINKNSEPLIDFGTPLIGHFRNKDIPKAVLYTVLFASSIIGIILFSPSQGRGTESRSIIPVERNISDPIFFSFLGTSLSSFAASSIDTAVTYHLANKKIIELNEFEWNRDLGINKHNFIISFKEEQAKKKIYENNDYSDEIVYYRKRLINGTITEDEVNFIERNDKIKEQLEKELGYYYINKELK